MKKTGALLIGWFVVSVLFLLGLEALTLSNDIAGDHITAVVRSAFAKEPWVFMWLSCSVSFLAGHFFASGRKS